MGLGWPSSKLPQTRVPNASWGKQRHFSLNRVVQLNKMQDRYQVIKLEPEYLIACMTSIFAEKIYKYCGIYYAMDIKLKVFRYNQYSEENIRNRR